jgi:molybdate transport system substrate-binding protein
MRRLLLGGTTAIALAASSLGAQATNINLAVASNFYGTTYGANTSAIYEVIQAFQSQYASSGYTVTVVDNGATATLASHITTGNTRGVDLFMAADVATPLSLYTSFSTMVTGAVFDYAIGYLAMLSGSSSYDVSCASGSCGYSPSAGYTSIAIATPTLAPYGEATKELLWSAYGIDLASPPVTVHYYSNITGPYTAVVNQTDPIGFVALSAICGPVPGEPGVQYPVVNNLHLSSNFSAVAFNPNEVRDSPITYQYKPLTQAAIRVALNSTRGAAENAELEAFATFLQDYEVATSSSTADSPMMTVLKKYCYSAPRQ